MDADGRATYFGYDAAGRNTTQTFTTPVTGETADDPITFTYDSVGNVRTVADSQGTFDQDYDTLNRQTRKVTFGGTVYYTFDRAGLKQTVKDTLLVETYFGYDAAGRLAHEQFLDTGKGAYFEYDRSGLMKKKAGPQSTVAASRVLSYFDYDNAGRLTTLTHKRASDLAVLGSYVYTRNPNGAVTYLQRDNSLNVYYGYDALDRLTSERWRDASTLVYGFLYNYDGASNRYFKYDEKAPLASYFTFDARNTLRDEETR